MVASRLMPVANKLFHSLYYKSFFFLLLCQYYKSKNMLALNVLNCSVQYIFIFILYRTEN
jgi:hypothetical protein